MIKQAKRITHWIGFTLFFSLILVLFTGCGGGGGETSPTASRTTYYLGTQSPGDVWTWALTMEEGTGTFSAANETLGYDYDGDVETLSNDFLLLTITSSNEPGMMLPAIAYAVEVPDTALIAMQAGDDQMVVCAAQGACPTVDAAYNWVPLVDSTFDDTSDTGYGVTDAIVSGPDFSFDSQFFLMDGSANGSESITGFSCMDGRLAMAGEPMTIGVTPSGMLIGDEGPGAGGFVGMQAPAAPVDVSDLLAAGREFRGFTNKARAGGDESEAVWARGDGLGNLLGGHYDDMETGIENSDPVTITLDTQNSPGIFNATEAEGADTIDLVIMAARINGRYFLYGAGGRSTHSVASNFLVIEH